MIVSEILQVMATIPKHHQELLGQLIFTHSDFRTRLLPHLANEERETPRLLAELEWTRERFDQMKYTEIVPLGTKLKVEKFGDLILKATEPQMVLFNIYGADSA